MQRHVFEPRVNVQARNIPVKAFVVVKLLPLQIKNIDGVAHAAGLISGLLLGLIPHRVPPPPPSGMTIEVSRAPQNQSNILGGE